MPRGKPAHGDTPIRARVLRHVERAHGEGVEAVELSLVYGRRGVDAAVRLARDGVIERVGTGMYRARRAT